MVLVSTPSQIPLDMPPVNNSVEDKKDEKDKEEYSDLDEFEDNDPPVIAQTIYKYSESDMYKGWWY